METWITNAWLSAAAAATWPAPSPLIAVAAASSLSAPSTFVQAAQLTTASGRASRDRRADGLRVGDVEVRARERDHVVRGRGGDDVGAEHARGPCDEKAHGDYE